MTWYWHWVAMRYIAHTMTHGSSIRHLRWQIHTRTSSKYFGADKDWPRLTESERNPGYFTKKHSSPNPKFLDFWTFSSFNRSRRYMDSTSSAVTKAQQAPQEPWFFTGLTAWQFGSKTPVGSVVASLPSPGHPRQTPIDRKRLRIFGQRVVCYVEILESRITNRGNKKWSKVNFIQLYSIMWLHYCHQEVNFHHIWLWRSTSSLMPLTYRSAC